MAKYYTYHPYNHYSDAALTEKLYHLSKNMKINSTKEHYLDWVKRWKNSYAAVAKEIKSIRVTIREIYATGFLKNRIPAFQQEIARLIRYANQFLELRRINKLVANVSSQLEYGNS